MSTWTARRRPNRSKERLKGGEVVAGIIIPSPTPLLVELAAVAGFDLIMADGEHSSISPILVEELARAATIAGVDLLVRPPARDSHFLAQYLDAGAQGVIVPGVSSVTDAQEVAAACRYGAPGKRGLGPCWANGYALEVGMEEYVAWADEQTLVLVMFEDGAVLPRLGELLSVAGVDGIVVGPRDLAHSLGRTGRPDDSVVQAAIDEAVRATSQLGKWVALPGNTPAAARASRERGGHIFLTYLPTFVASAGGEFLRAAGRR